jgi:hypothetical protein
MKDRQHNGQEGQTTAEQNPPQKTKDRATRTMLKTKCDTLPYIHTSWAFNGRKTYCMYFCNVCMSDKYATLNVSFICSYDSIVL